MRTTARLATLTLVLSAAAAAQTTTPIWTDPPHAAFTDLAEFDGRLVCTFRESSRHVGGTDGKIRVIRSASTADPAPDTWESAAFLALDGTDLRDPKLSVTPDHRLMLLVGGSVYDGKTLVRRGPYAAFATNLDDSFGELTPVEIDPAIATDNDWLWRVTWHGGVAWGVVYQSGSPDERVLRLVRSDDGVRYKLAATLDVTGQPNETTLRFDDHDRMVALVRREGADKHGVVGVAEAPYDHWTWAELPVRLGGPDFLFLPDHSILAASRAYPTPDHPGTRTVLARLTLGGDWDELLTLPSAGDTSYPGLLIEGDTLLCSYYSSHESKTSIYLSRVPLDQLTTP